MFAKGEIILSFNNEQQPTFTVWDRWTKSWRNVCADRIISCDVGMQFGENTFTVQSYSTRIAINTNGEYDFTPAAVVGMAKEGYIVADAKGQLTRLPYNYVYKTEERETLMYSRTTGELIRRLPYVIVNCTNNTDMYPPFAVAMCTWLPKVTLPLNGALKTVYLRRVDQWHIYAMLGRPGSVVMNGYASTLRFGYSHGWEKSEVVPGVSQICSTVRPSGVSPLAVAEMTRLHCASSMHLCSYCFNTTAGLRKLNVTAPCVFDAGIFDDAALASLQYVHLNVYSCPERMFAELLALPELQTLELEIQNSRCIEQIVCPDAQVRGEKAFDTHNITCRLPVRDDLKKIKVKLSGDVTDRIRGYFADCIII